MTYIEQNLNSSLSKKIEHQVELIHYDYYIRTLELEYFQHKSNEYQKQLMKQICQNKLINNSNLLLNMNVDESHLVDDPPSAHQEKKRGSINTKTKSKKDLTKRKRDVSLQQQSNLNTTIPKSISSISILQPSLKKVKHKQKTITNTNISSIEVQQNTLKRTYRRPMYLKRSPKILIKMLSRTLNYTFKEKADERFIFVHLDLFDRFYCLRIDLQLWESYLDIGLQQHL
ncbi:unnamed protein product [Rotaria socialis]